MSKREAKELKKMLELVSHSDENYIPVFYARENIEIMLMSMAQDARKLFFKRIGVRKPQRIVFFEADNELEGRLGPVPQKNGLMEYKLPAGTGITNYKCIKI